jgi:hypothetical protein
MPIQYLDQMVVGYAQTFAPPAACTIVAADLLLLNHKNLYGKISMLDQIRDAYQLLEKVKNIPLLWRFSPAESGHTISCQTDNPFFLGYGVDQSQRVVFYQRVQFSSQGRKIGRLDFYQEIMTQYVNMKTVHFDF